MCGTSTSLGQLTELESRLGLEELVTSEESNSSTSVSPPYKTPSSLTSSTVVLLINAPTLLSIFNKLILLG